MGKYELRRDFCTLRECLPPEEVAAASVALCQRLAAWPVLRQARVVLTYLAFRNEIDLSPLFEHLPEKRWVVPRVEGRRLVLHPYDPTRLLRHRFGMLEPAVDLPAVDPATLDVALVPGVAFDRQGGRLGFGGGYYDRLLPTTPALRVGVTYDGCLTDELPCTEADQRMDWIVTPGGLLFTGRPSKRAHTFSIVARDPESGEMGVAVQSHWFSVGSLVAWAEAGVGAVATQALAEVTYGPLGLAFMRAGKPAPEALAALLAADEGRELRQVAMVDAQGQVAAHTGARCIADAGHETGEGFSVQANMMACPDVWPAMARAYREAEGDLAERLLATLEAGQAAGGDIRGQQSACILTVRGTSTGRPGADTVLDMRVEDHPQPMRELRRLVNLHRAYQHMNRGDELLGAGKVEEALQEYRAAAEMAPESEELSFWHAVTLADLGRVDEALPIFRDVFARNANWATLLPRLPQAGLLRDDAEMIRRILALVS